MPKRRWANYAGFILNLGRASLSGFWTLEARLKGVSVGRGVTFVGRPLISVANGSRLQLGNNVKDQQFSPGQSPRLFPAKCSQNLVSGRRTYFGRECGDQRLCALRGQIHSYWRRCQHRVRGIVNGHRFSPTHRSVGMGQRPRARRQADSRWLRRVYRRPRHRAQGRHDW